MSNFTPGKWEAHPHRIMVNGHTLAIVNWPNNTRLIAAAPEMYKLLRTAFCEPISFRRLIHMGDTVQELLARIDGNEEQEQTASTLNPLPQRESKDAYYLKIAEAVLARSTCLRRKYGAVLVKDDEIISTGYNGSPRGAENCCDAGHCYRDAHQIPHGERYEACVAVHAEANAIISASRREMIDATLYLAGQEADGSPIADVAPCVMCQRLIENAGISRVVTRQKENAR